jgi:pimeloyl-ACP methyl ester carboxylesterase
MTRHRTVGIDGLDVFYREAGDEGAPAILLLHGFPTSSHMFRRLLPRLGTAVRCVAPDLPGFGYTTSPPAGEFAYTFDRLAEATTRFVDRVGLERFALYVFDFGAPVGFRLAAAQPERIKALIVQNGNAYQEGLSPATEPLQAYWGDRRANEPEVRGLLTLEGTKLQYTHGTRDPERLEPDAWTLDQHFLDLPGRDQVMLDLFYDYRTNVESYPRWQAYLRRHRPPTLVVWGKNDPFFTVEAAKGYLNDVPEAELHLLDTGHFALEGGRRGDRRAHQSLPAEAWTGAEDSGGRAAGTPAND